MQHHYYLSFCSKHSLVPVSWWGLTFPFMWDYLLLNCHSLGGRPIRVATEAVGASGSNVVLGIPPLISAGDAVVVGANWMDPMQTAVGAHVMDLLHLGLPLT
jgi:hypothetical protein